MNDVYNSHAFLAPIKQETPREKHIKMKWNPQSNNSELLILSLTWIKGNFLTTPKRLSCFSLRIIQVKEDYVKYFYIHHETSEGYQSNILVKSCCLSLLESFSLLTKNPYTRKRKQHNRNCFQQMYPQNLQRVVLGKSVEILTQKLIGLKRFLRLFLWER